MAVKVINKKEQYAFCELDAHEYFMFEGDLFLKIESVLNDETGDSFNAIHLESGTLEFFCGTDTTLRVKDIEITIK